MTKKQAHVELAKVIKGAPAKAPAWFDKGARDMLDALDRAGAFMDEETVAEIAIASEHRDNCTITWERDATFWRNAYLNLVAACRKAGLVGAE